MEFKNLSEDFKVLFMDLQRMSVPDWIVTLFDFVQNTDINSQLQDELTDMRGDIEAQSLVEHKNLCNSAMQIPLLNTWNLVQLLSRFTCIPNFILYMLEYGVSHANTFLKKKNRLISEERGDLLLNTTISI